MIMLAGTRLRLVSGGAGLVTTEITIATAITIGEAAIDAGLETVTSPSNLQSTPVCRFFHMRDSEKVIATRSQALPDGKFLTQSIKACERVCRRSNQVRLRVLHQSVIERRGA